MASGAPAIHCGNVAGAMEYRKKSGFEQEMANYLIDSLIVGVDQNNEGGSRRLPKASRRLPEGPRDISGGPRRLQETSGKPPEASRRAQEPPEGLRMLRKIQSKVDLDRRVSRFRAHLSFCS